MNGRIRKVERVNGERVDGCDDTGLIKNNSFLI